MTLNDLARHLRPLVTRVGNMVAPALVERVDDATKMQACQISLSEGEVRADVEHPQNYGFTSVPFAGAEATVVCVGGRRDHCIVLTVDDRRYRLKGLAEGEVALYTDQGDKIVLGRGGNITITASSKVTVNAPLVEVPSGDVTAQGVSLKNHVHSNGNTGVPPGGGLMAPNGPVTGNTGAPL
jgi:phage baseplate assembly protein V